MKHLSALFFSVLVITSANAHEFTNTIAAIMGDVKVTSAIDNFVNGRSSGDYRYFEGILKSDLQTGCTGDRVYFDLIFSRLKDKGGSSLEKEECRLTVTFGECGTASGKVNSVSNEPICTVKP